MHELVEQELYAALRYAKTVDEDQGKRLMIQFEIDQPVLFQTLFNTFASIIGDRHAELSHLFMDLCFETLCVYQHSFGKMPKMQSDPNFMERQIALVDKELKPLLTHKTADFKRSQRMKEKFFGEKDGETTQHGLVRFLNQSIDEYVSDDSSCDEASVEMTKTMIFVVVRLLNNLYSKPTLQ
jgi:hypothetical protein